MCKKYTLDLRLKNNWRIHVSSNLEQVVVFRLINKNMVELDVIVYVLQNACSIFAALQNVWWSILSFETQSKIISCYFLVAERPWKYPCWRIQFWWHYRNCNNLIKKAFKDSIKFKRIRNYVLKSNCYLYFPI